MTELLQKFSIKTKNFYYMKKFLNKNIFQKISPHFFEKNRKIFAENENLKNRKFSLKNRFFGKMCFSKKIENFSIFKIFQNFRFFLESKIFWGTFSYSRNFLFLLKIFAKVLSWKIVSPYVSPSSLASVYSRSRFFSENVTGWNRFMYRVKKRDL